MTLARATPLLILLSVAAGGAALSVACRPDRRIGTDDKRGAGCKVQDDCPYYLVCTDGACYETCAPGATYCQYFNTGTGHCKDGACLAGPAPLPGTDTPTFDPTPTPTPTTTATTTPPPTCFTAPTTSSPVNAFGSAAAPPASPTDCTQGQVDTFRTACLGASATKATCDAFTNDAATNGTCIACLAEQGSRLSVTYSTLDQKSALVELSGCIALVAGKPECAVPLARRESCRLRQCFNCASATDSTACEAYADLNNCHSVTVPASCEGLIESTKCVGTSFDESYAKVAKILCVSGPDAGP